MWTPGPLGSAGTSGPLGSASALAIPPPLLLTRIEGQALGTTSSRDASGRQANRNGAYLLVPRPAETCSQLDPQRDRPRTRSRGRSQLVTSAPTPGRRTCPPWVWPARSSP